MDEIRSLVLSRPGSTVITIAETYRGRRNDWLYQPVMRGVLGANYLTAEEDAEVFG